MLLSLWMYSFIKLRLHDFRICSTTLNEFQSRQDYGDKWLKCGQNIYRQTKIQCWGPMPLWYIWVEWTQLKMVLVEQDAQLRQLNTVRILLRWWQRWKSQLRVVSQAENDGKNSSQWSNDSAVMCLRCQEMLQSKFGIWV